MRASTEPFPPVKDMVMRLGFLAWLMFAAAAFVTGLLGAEMTLAHFLLTPSGYCPPAFMELMALGAVAIPIAWRWRVYGVKHLRFIEIEEEMNRIGGLSSDHPDMVHTSQIEALAAAIDAARGWERQRARAVAKAWITKHRAELQPDDMALAQSKFGYLIGRV